MGLKVKMIVPIALFAICILVISVYAATLTEMIDPDSFSIQQTDTSVMNEVRTLTFWINNTESVNLKILSITNLSNITHETYDNQTMPFVFNLTMDDIPANTNNSYEIKITMDSEHANLIGIYRGWINVTGWTDTLKTHNMMLTVNLSDTINMTVLNVNPITEGIAQPGDALKINVIPSYWNDVLIPGLDITNFAVSISHTNSTTLTAANVSTSLDVTDAQIVGGSYELTTRALNSTLFGGNYSVTVSLIHPTFTGSDTYSSFAIDQAALKMSLVSCSATNSIYVGGGSNATACGFNLINYGYKTATNINVSFNPTSGLSVSPSNVTNLFDLASMANRTNYTTVAGLTVGTSNLYINATTSDDVKWDVQNISATYTVSVYTTTPTDDDDDTTTTTTTTSNTETTPRSSFKHKLEVTPPATFEITQGGTASNTVAVKNAGTYTEYNVALSLSGISSSWYTVSTEPQKIVTTTTKQYDVSYKIPENAEPATYTITYKANGKTADGSTTGTMKVLPNSETKEAIAANLTEYTTWFGDVMRMANQTKLNETNLTEVKSMLSQVTGLLTKADSHINLGEYLEAYQTLKQVRELLTQAQSELSEGGKAGFALPSDIMIIAIGVGAAALIGIGIAVKKGKLKKPKFSKPSYRFQPKDSRFSDFRKKLKNKKGWRPRLRGQGE